MYFITEYNYPARKAAQIGKLYLEMMKKCPHDRSIEKPIILSAVWTEEGRIRIIAVSSVKKGNLKECMELSTNWLLMICNEVEEFQFHFRVAYELAEALPIVGLQPAEQAPELF